MPAYNRLTRQQRHTIEAMNRKHSPQKEIAAALGGRPRTAAQWHYPPKLLLRHYPKSCRIPRVERITDRPGTLQTGGDQASGRALESRADQRDLCQNCGRTSQPRDHLSAYLSRPEGRRNASPASAPPLQILPQARFWARTPGPDQEPSDDRRTSTGRRGALSDRGLGNGHGDRQVRRQGVSNDGRAQKPLYPDRAGGKQGGPRSHLEASRSARRAPRESRNDDFRQRQGFVPHELLADLLDAKAYFAHPYHSWERGLNENTNGLILQYFPKGSSFDALTIIDVERVENLLNTRPRKCLAYQHLMTSSTRHHRLRWPLEFAEKMMNDQI
jgi:hypothetical protein